MNWLGLYRRHPPDCVAAFNGFTTLFRLSACVQIVTKNFIISENCTTMRINSEVWALGLARPYSQFSSVRGLVRK